MMKEDTAREADDCGLKQKSERRMNKRKVAVWHLPGSDSRCAVEHIARVPQDREVGVLQKHDAHRRSEEADRGGQISECKAGRQLVGLEGSTPVSTIRDDSSRGRNTAHKTALKRSPSEERRTSRPWSSRERGSAAGFRWSCACAAPPQ